MNDTQPSVCNRPLQRAATQSRNLNLSVEVVVAQLQRVERVDSGEGGVEILGFVMRSVAEHAHASARLAGAVGRGCVHGEVAVGDA